MGRWFYYFKFIQKHWWVLRSFIRSCYNSSLTHHCHTNTIHHRGLLCIFLCVVLSLGVKYWISTTWELAKQKRNGFTISGTTWCHEMKQGNKEKTIQCCCHIKIVKLIIWRRSSSGKVLPPNTAQRLQGCAEICDSFEQKIRTALI